MGVASLPTGRSRASSFRQFRFWAALCVVGVLFWFLLGALEREAQRAEKAAVGVVLNQLRAALVIKAAEVRVTGRGAYEDWGGTNPMALLKTAPPTYSGACGSNAFTPGQWCFGMDTASGQGSGRSGVLIYQPDQPISIGEQQGSRESALRWVVTTEFTDRNRNGRLDNDDLPTGLKLQPAAERNNSENQETPGGPDT